MNRNNWLSGREKELHELAQQYEEAKAAGKPCYMDAEDIADVVDWYAVNRKHEKAFDLVNYGLSLHPHHTALLVEKAYIYLDQNLPEKADEVIGSINENTSEVKVLRASFLIAEGRIEEAERLIDEIEDKDELYNIIDVVYMYIDHGMPQRALPWIERNHDRYADEEPFLALEADCNYTLMRFEEAMVCYNKLIDKNPYAPLYWLGLARCYQETGQYDKAIEACDYVTVIDEKMGEAYLVRGHAYYQLGNPEATLREYTKAHEMGAVSGCFLHAFIGLGELDEGKWKSALEHLEQAIDEFEYEEVIPLAMMYSSAALCLHHLGKKRKPHQYCKLARELNPGFKEIHLVEGRIYLGEGDVAKATEAWERALRIDEGADTWNEIGHYCVEMGMLPYAATVFEHVAELNPEFPGVNEQLASLYLVMQNIEKFKKYNDRCENPIELNHIQQMMDMLSGGEQNEDIQRLLDQIIKKMR